MTPRVPATCLSCGAAWTPTPDWKGDYVLPEQKTKVGLRVWYDCGASLSIKADLGDGAYTRLFKDCGEEKP